MAVLESVKTGERVEIDGEIPFGAGYVVEGYDEDNDEYWEEERVEMNGTEYIVVDDGVDMVTIGEDEKQSTQSIPNDWQKTWAESEGKVLYATPDGDHAVVWQGKEVIESGSLSIEPGPLEWYELDQIRGEEFTSDEAIALEETIETLSVAKIAPYTFPREESENPGEVLDLDGDFIAVEYDEDEVFDELYGALPDSSNISRTELENIVSEVHGRFLISAHLEFE